MTIRLSRKTLDEAAGHASVPSYDRTKLTAGIVHFGIGNFHRAHQAVYLDDLFDTGRDHDWALLGAGVLPSDAEMREMLAGQDFLTTVVEQEAERSRARVTGSMIGFLDPADRSAVIDRLTDPAIRIVSMTITEGGYFIDASGSFDPEHPAISADGQNPDDPKTVFGLIVAGLKRRRAAGTVPFTVMSCDNIPHNGVVARNAVIGVARLSDPELADWIGDTVAFPNAMVDRITPATGNRERALLAQNFGIEDAWPVFCETFRQWVLEDKFTAGRPALETVGVQFVPDVTPYETMKIRILNGGHAIIAYPAGLMDIEFAHEAMEDATVRAFLDKVEHEEIIPFVPPVARHRSWRLFHHHQGAFRQSQDRRHHPPAMPRRLQQAAEIHRAVDRSRARKGCVHRRAGARIRALVPILFRHERKREEDRGQRSELGEAAGRRARGQGRPLGVACHEGDLR